MVGNLWRMPRETEGMVGFTRDLGYEANLGYFSLANNTGFVLTWDYHEKHLAEIMITKDRSRENSVIVDRFWGVRPGGISTGGVASSSDELRGAAEIYDEVTRLLGRKFGEPVSEHDGRSIYRAPLEEVVAA